MTRDVKQRLQVAARDLGFAGMAVAAAVPLPDTRRVFDERIAAGMFDGLPWFNHERAERATTPERALDGVRSIITLAVPYRGAIPVSAVELGSRARGRIAGYAWGRDYHRVLERKLQALCRTLDA